uniref:Uncharacterized protein n=1 Tax=Oryza brachyantha TaxID=4533 RepID=J3MFH0_ORYBR
MADKRCKMQVRRRQEVAGWDRDTNKGVHQSLVLLSDSLFARHDEPFQKRPSSAISRNRVIPLEINSSPFATKTSRSHEERSKLNLDKQTKRNVRRRFSCKAIDTVPSDQKLINSFNHIYFFPSQKLLYKLKPCQSTHIYMDHGFIHK